MDNNEVDKQKKEYNHNKKEVEMLTKENELLKKQVAVSWLQTSAVLAVSLVCFSLLLGVALNSTNQQNIPNIQINEPVEIDYERIGELIAENNEEIINNEKNNEEVSEDDSNQKPILEESEVDNENSADLKQEVQLEEKLSEAADKFDKAVKNVIGSINEKVNSPE